MDTNLKINVNDAGIEYITIEKSFQHAASGILKIPQTNKEAIKLVIKDLQEMIKEKD